MSKHRIWYFLDGLKGDKVVWLIVLMLIMLSIVCNFSSTSTLESVMKGMESRVDVVVDLLRIVLLGLLMMLICYNILSVQMIRKLSKWGFPLSAVLLLIVVTHFRAIPFFKADQINGVWRIIKVGRYQLHIYEIIKVAMVMYVSWAIVSIKEGTLSLINALSQVPHLGWLSKEIWQRVLLIYLPCIMIVLPILKGSGSSAMIVGGILAMIILLGGISKKDVLVILALAAIGVGGLIVVNNIQGGELREELRIDTWKNRIIGMDKEVERFKNSEYKSVEYYKSLDKIRQGYSVKIAIHQGKLLGKGAGQSTQRYIVPVMFEDYMYSFILEEYGLAGGFIVLFLYLALLARGSYIIKKSDGKFEKLAIAGLVLLISGQAILHILVNVDIGIPTGQTLPLISYGASSFVSFCIAFGLILSISRFIKKEEIIPVEDQNNTENDE